MRLTRSISIVGAALAAFVFSASIAAPSYADAEPTVVEIPICDFFDGGVTTVEAGEVAASPAGWGEKNLGRLMQFLRSQQTTMTVQYGSDPATITDLTDQWSEPVPLENDWFSGLPIVPLGTLAPGDTVRVQVDLSWTMPKPSGSVNPSCLITAV
jgi:hypothetical protein